MASDDKILRRSLRRVLASKTSFPRLLGLGLHPGRGEAQVVAVSESRSILEIIRPRLPDMPFTSMLIKPLTAKSVPKLLNVESSMGPAMFTSIGQMCGGHAMVYGRGCLEWRFPSVVVGDTRVPMGPSKVHIGRGYVIVMFTHVLVSDIRSAAMSELLQAGFRLPSSPIKVPVPMPFYLPHGAHGDVRAELKRSTSDKAPAFAPKLGRLVKCCWSGASICLPTHM